MFVCDLMRMVEVTPKTLGKIMASQLDDIAVEHTRNFSIVAHIDHGKSTLADRLLELSGNITSKERESAQHLDNLQVERERGITVKAQTASMLYHDKKSNERYLLNLVDTPGTHLHRSLPLHGANHIVGHVDFSYEVSRSLSACEGVLLLVDASQGIQSQTLATYHAAKDKGLRVVPVLTKIDMPHAQPDECMLSLSALLGMKTTTEAKIGDTFFHPNQPVEPLPGFQEVRSMVFASMYPTDECSFDDLRNAMGKLTLNDASVSAQIENSGALGMG
ncbi:hypothetical protein DYB28_009535 [Aphanomyces astaci]|uniref:Tr-type G domain-containing protein n=1 Tax=Aphanomyces astaci TaxID=112090 RepID=A0A9X8HDZ5_APHAT|nr:hypothetical protein DYB28_009535 [Aphanomyces astaci]